MRRLLWKYKGACFPTPRMRSLSTPSPLDSKQVRRLFLKYKARFPTYQAYDVVMEPPLGKPADGWR